MEDRDLERLEERVRALEEWRNQVLGARKIAWILWIVIVGIATWIAAHWPK
jgi:hypothetical protein